MLHSRAPQHIIKQITNPFLFRFLFRCSVLCLSSFTIRVEGEKTQLTNAAVRQAATEPEGSNRKDTPASDVSVQTTSTSASASASSTQSNIYRIKRLNLSKDKPKLRKQQRIEEGHHGQVEHHQQQQQHSPFIQQDTGHYADDSKDIPDKATTRDIRLSNKAKSKKVKNLGKNSHGLNKKLLT